MHKRIFFTGILICLSSCTLGPDYISSPIYPDKVIANELQLKENGILPNNWYENLGDANLQNLIKKGLKNNTDISISAAKLKQARLKSKINSTEYLPQINAQGGYNYQKSSKNIEYSQDSHYYNAGFDASWELDIWGKGRRQSEADKANILAQSFTLSNIKTLVAAEIAVNYINLLQNRENLRMAVKNAELQRQISDVVQKEYQNGLKDQIAYNQSQYLIQSTLAQIPQYESNIEIYKNTLSTLIGILPSEIQIPDTANLLNKNAPDITADMRKLPLTAIRLRPDVAAAEQTLIQQNALVGKAIADIYPNINIGAVFTYSAGNFNKLFSSDSEGYSYTPSANIPLLDWNKLQNNVKLQKQEKIIALANYRQSILNALNELKNAFSNYETALQAYKIKQKALISIQKVNEQMLKRHRNGLANFSDILSSQQNLVASQNEVINAKAQMIKYIIAYYKASGATISN